MAELRLKILAALALALLAGCAHVDTGSQDASGGTTAPAPAVAPAPPPTSTKPAASAKTPAARTPANAGKSSAPGARPAPQPANADAVASPAAVPAAAAAAPAPPAAPTSSIDDTPASDSIFFADGKRTVDERDKDLLRRHIVRLKDDSRLLLTLVAHTPGQGSRSYNLALAADWMEEIAKVLRSAGVPRKQLHKEIARQPRDWLNCATNACRQQLRRVDLVYR